MVTRLPPSREGSQPARADSAARRAESAGHPSQATTGSPAAGAAALSFYGAHDPRGGEQSERPVPTAPTERRAVSRAYALRRDAAHPAHTADEKASRSRALEPVETTAVAHRTQPRTPGCPRCGGSHTGLCARLMWGARATAARWLGVRVADVESDARTEDRQRIVEILGGLPDTKHGRDRALAVATCGRLEIVSVGGDVRLQPALCRDRICPRCQVQRARKLASQLREAWHLRRAEIGDVHWFVTLTIPKPLDLDPDVAIKRVLQAWRRISNTKNATGREMRKRGILGGVVASEITWSRKGDRTREGHVVAFDGWHCHLHLLVEGGDFADVRWLLAQWTEEIDGSIRAQDYAPVDERRIGQLAKYLVKPWKHGSLPMDLARRLAVALHGRRLHRAWGTWKSWKSWLEQTEAPPLSWAVDASGERRLAPEDLIRLYASPETREAPIRFVDRTRETTRVVSATELVALVRADRERDRIAQEKRGAQGPPRRAEDFASAD